LKRIKFLKKFVDYKKPTGKTNEYNDNNNPNKTASNSNNNINYKNIQTANINKEELLKFVYDISSQNLTASSFKYALRNLKDDQKEKEEYFLVKKFIKIFFEIFIFNFKINNFIKLFKFLNIKLIILKKKINPNYIPNIFQNDIDKDALVDIFTCLRGIINRSK